MVDVITGLNPDLKPTLVNFKDFAFVCDGDNVPRYMDANGGFIWMHVDPTTALTSDESQAGSMTGIVVYFYTEYNKASGDGDFYSGHETNPSPTLTTGSLVSKKVVLTLPATAENTGFTHLKVYGTSPGGAIFYHIGEVAIGTTTFEDNFAVRTPSLAWGKVTTSSSGAEEQADLNFPVQNAQYIVATKTRIFTFGVRLKTDGTITTNGTTAVVGVSTLWTKALEGSILFVNNESEGFVVDTVTDASNIVLATAYTGSNQAGATYVILHDEQRIEYSELHPITKKSMWWAFPEANNVKLSSQDSNPTKGGGLLGDQVVIFKENAYYVLTESGDDYIPTRSTTEIGTTSHGSITPIPSTGSLLFMSGDGKLYEANGLNANDLDVDLNKTADGVNTERLELMEGMWLDTKKWFMLMYSSSGSSEHDRFLVYDFRIKEWVIWTIRANATAIIQNAQNVKFPYMGTTSGFVYKMLTGNNFGASSGTLSGTVTSGGNTTLTDSTATFDTTDDGLKDVYVSKFNSLKVFTEERRIDSNTGTALTVDTAWDDNPVAGDTYEVGCIRCHWESKTFDHDTDDSKTVKAFLLNFKQLEISRNILVEFWFSEDPDMEGDTLDQSLTFDLSQKYLVLEGLADNRARFSKFRISWHGVDFSAEINQAIFDVIRNSR